MVSVLSILGSGILYAALAIFFIGFVARMLGWLKIPVPLKIPLTPAPTSMSGVIGRMATEVFVFRSLFKSDKALWVGGYLFHVSFALIILRHLRYFIEPLPWFVVNVQTLGVYAGFGLVIAASYLFFRRLFFERVKYVTTYADQFLLLLIGGIGISGLWMKYIDRVFVVDVKNFVVGALTLNLHDPPTNIVFWIHFILVAGLMAYFPYSKLMHAGGIFVSPTRNQRDNARDRRFINPWNAAFPDPTIPEYKDGDNPPIDEL